MKRIVLSTSVVLLASSHAQAITVTPTLDPTVLVNNILGPGVSLVGAPSLQAVTNQVGTFSNGFAEVGFGSGIVLSSGNINNIPGPNSNTGVPETRGNGFTAGEDISTDLGQPGVIEIANSFDGAALDFTFQFLDGSVGGDLNFAFVFASEEYVNFIGSQFNDEFELLIDGVNVGLVGGTPVNVNNVNDAVNSGFYINNVANTNGIPNANRNLSFDGLTTQLVASVIGLGPGTHTARFIVADVADGILDAGVFIQAGSFNPDIPEFGVPLPAGLPLLLSGLGALAFLGRRAGA